MKWAALAALALLSFQGSKVTPNPHLIVYRGDKGPGAGKHIVWLAGDHEYAVI